MIMPIACMTSSEAMNPPMLMMPVAVPRVRLGLNVRAWSKPTIEPGPPMEITMINTTSNHSGAGPGSASTTAQMAALLAMMPSTSHDRRCGLRAVMMPIRIPAAMAAATDTVSNAPAVPRESPCASVRYGMPHISANTVMENWQPMCVKKPSRVPGRSQTVLRLPNVSARSALRTTWARPRGVSRTTTMVSTTTSTPKAAADR